MKTFLLSQVLATCLVLVYQVASSAAQAETKPIYSSNKVTTQIHNQRNFNFGGMYATVVKYIVRAINFTYNLINSPPVCHLLNNCKESQIHAPIPLRPGDYDNSPYAVEENLISHDTLTNTEYTGPLIDALLSTNVDNVKSNEANTDSSEHEVHDHHDS